jgi:hypothetical protein
MEKQLIFSWDSVTRSDKLISKTSRKIVMNNKKSSLFSVSLAAKAAKIPRVVSHSFESETQWYQT